ncbi:hypothetical protein ACO0RG_002742 [Hanseniaspora osmophila]|uniref:Bud emergence protein 1 n=1 Tax=Hanseniaspora osmophila TaxID=56408 RepID=A0A1E5R7Y1_9ASCO|nr:Bud emergence protein 1 [Hanseniaspora osmophila]
MLKNFKLKKDHKRNITVADISGPTTSLNDAQLKGMNTVPIRNASNSTTKQYPLSSLSSGATDSKPSRASSSTNTEMHSTKTNPSLQAADTAMNNLPSLYAIVLYDFQAEKSDELTCHTGENLFVCAHHNFEWFIAKPIGRLGGPGLVPISFVSIIDINTGYATGNDTQYDISSSGLPTVQEWKQSVVKYKASNINLGSVESSYQEESHLSQPDSSLYAQHRVQEISEQRERKPSRISFTSLQENPMDEVMEQFILDAAVENYTLEDHKYWFHLTCITSNGLIRSLRRSYEDFYDMQVRILEAFPREAGKIMDKKTGRMSERIVPYIPGPVPYVTDTITKQRKDDLNLYVKELTNLPIRISRCSLVLQLFEIRENKFDKEFLDTDNAMTLNNIKARNNSSSNVLNQHYKNSVSQISQKEVARSNSKEEQRQESDRSSRLRSHQSSTSSLHHPYHQQLNISNQSSPNRSINRSTSNNSFTGYLRNSSHKSLSKNTSSEMLNKYNNNNFAPSNANEEDSTLTNTDINQFQNLSINNSQTGKNANGTSSTTETKAQKVKFYYKDDIFALLIKPTISFSELVDKIATRVESDRFHLYLKVNDENTISDDKITTDEQIKSIVQNKQKIFILDV